MIEVYNGAKDIVLDYYNKHDFEKTKKLISYYVIRDFLHYMYTIFVAKKEVDDIKSLPVEDKKKLWGYVQQFNISEKEKIKAAKALYCMHLIFSENI